MFIYLKLQLFKVNQDNGTRDIKQIKDVALTSASYIRETQVMTKMRGNAQHDGRRPSIILHRVAKKTKPPNFGSNFVKS